MCTNSNLKIIRWYEIDLRHDHCIWTLIFHVLLISNFFVVKQKIGILISGFEKLWFFYLLAFTISSCGTMIFLISFFRVATGAWPLRFEMSVGPELSLNFMATTSFLWILPFGATLTPFVTVCCLLVLFPLNTNDLYKSWKIYLFR